MENLGRHLINIHKAYGKSGKEGDDISNGNKNITAASIAFKVPFVLYSIVTVRKGLLKIILSLILFAALFSISVLYARAAI